MSQRPLAGLPPEAGRGEDKERGGQEVVSGCEGGGAEGCGECSATGGGRGQEELGSEVGLAIY